MYCFSISKIIAMKKVIVIYLLSLYSVIAVASVQYEGINYKINTSLNTAVVVKSNCSENLIIPESISIDGKKYDVIEIDKYAFQDCKELLSVELPASIKKIGALSFNNGNEVNIFITDLSAWCSIDFDYTTKTTNGLIYYPIGDYRLFLNGIEINDLVIPENVTRIGANSFSGCKSLHKVFMHDNVKSVNDYAFYKCENLTSVKFGENVLSIGEYSFCKCSSLDQVKLPSSIQAIKKGALQSLDRLTEIVIPGNVQTIESGCFLHDTNLSSVKFDDSESVLTVEFGQYSDQPLFVGCPLQKIYLGRNLKKKTGASNSGGYNISPFKDQLGLTTVIIGDNVKCIGEELFSGCGALVSINTPNSIEEIGTGAFNGCVSLPVINNIRYADKCAISVTDKEITNYELLPDTRFIMYSCFSNCVNMERLLLPEDIVFIGEYAFENCTNLTEISIPDNVNNISKGVFYGCKKLLDITIPSSAKNIGVNAFSGCKTIKEMNIPKNILGVQDGAFSGCSSLAKLTIEDSPQSIGFGTCGYSKKSLFYDCPLEEVYIGRDIGMYYMSTDKHDYLPFYNKNEIKKITIGANVSGIWDYSFYGCTAIDNIILLGEEPIALQKNTFSNTLYSKCILSVPENSVPLYSSSYIWGNFQHIVENITEDIVTAIQKVVYKSNRIVLKYDLNGWVGNIKPGIKIVKDIDGNTMKVVDR